MPDTEIAYDELLSTMGRRIQPNAIRKLTTLLGRQRKRDPGDDDASRGAVIGMPVIGS